MRVSTGRFLSKDKTDSREINNEIESYRQRIVELETENKELIKQSKFIAIQLLDAMGKIAKLRRKLAGNA